MEQQPTFKKKILGNADVQRNCPPQVHRLSLEESQALDKATLEGAEKIWVAMGMPGYGLWGTGRLTQ